MIQTENKINEHNKFETNFKENVIIQKRLVKEEFILILDFYQIGNDSFLISKPLRYNDCALPRYRPSSHRLDGNLSKFTCTIEHSVSTSSCVQG